MNNLLKIERENYITLIERKLDDKEIIENNNKISLTDHIKKIFDEHVIIHTKDFNEPASTTVIEVICKDGYRCFTTNSIIVINFISEVITNDAKSDIICFLCPKITPMYDLILFDNEYTQFLDKLIKEFTKSGTDTIMIYNIDDNSLIFNRNIYKKDVKRNPINKNNYVDIIRKIMNKKNIYIPAYMYS